MTFSAFVRATVAFGVWLLSASAVLAAVGTVQFSAGDVRIRDVAGNIRTVQKGDPVNEGDAILTGVGASAQLKMSDGGVIAVRPDTELKIDTYQFSGKEDGKERALMSLLKGGFRTITGIIGRTNKQNYLVTTPTATIGIRGTDHEPHFIPPVTTGPNPPAPPGSYDKVNVGVAFIRTPVGEINIRQNQVGFAAPNQAPTILPVVPEFFKATPPVRTAEKPPAEKPAAEKPAATPAPSEKPAPSVSEKVAATPDPSEAPEPSPVSDVRPIAVVDNRPPTSEEPPPPPPVGAPAPPPPPPPLPITGCFRDQSGAVQCVNLTDLSRSLAALGCTVGVQIVCGTGTNSFAHVLLAPVKPSGAGLFEANASGPQPLTDYSLDAATNALAKITNTSSTTGTGTVEFLSSATPQETFIAADGSIGLGRWEGGNFNVPGSPPQNTLGSATFPPILSAHWLLGVQPGAGVVQAYSGSLVYNKSMATSPTDSAGNVGTLNNAFLTANFSSQTVDAGVNLSIASKTLDASAAGMPISGGLFATQSPSPTVTCIGASCAFAYAAEIKGMFAGSAANSAGFGYNISGNLTDLIQGAVAFQAAANPQIAGTVAAVQAATDAAAFANQIAAALNLAGSPTLAGQATTAANQATAAATAVNTAVSNLLAATTTSGAQAALDAVNAAIAAANSIAQQTITTASSLLTQGGPAALAQIDAFDAQTDADLALAAFNTALLAETATNSTISSLLALSLVDTTPAISAISAATTNFNSAQTVVTNVISLPAPDLALANSNALTSSSLATTSATRASQAQAAFTANDVFADPIYAAVANTATQSANSTVQSSNTTVQNALADAQAANAALSAAISAAQAALTSASSALATANSQLTTANTNNSAITTAQGQAATLSTQAATAVAAANTAQLAAQTAATNAQGAATLAAQRQAVGDLVGAQAALNTALTELTNAQTQLNNATAAQASAQAASSSATAQLNTAKAAVTAATNAVSAAVTAANNAQTAASTASAQAAAATTAQAAAVAAVSTTSSELANAQTAASTVAANYLQAQYSNPASEQFTLGGTGGFVHGVLAQMPVAGGTEHSVFESTADHLRTNYVLNENKDLIEIRDTQYQRFGVNYTAQSLIPSANVKFSGGTVQDHTTPVDGVIYLGRWASGQIDVTDVTSTVAPFTQPLGPTSVHWILGPTPPDSLTLTTAFGPVNTVQVLTGTANYTLAAATHPTDSFGNVGILNSAMLTANFSSQTVNAALGLSFSTRDSSFTATATNVPIQKTGFNAFPGKPYAPVINCTGVDCASSGYEGNISGSFAAGGISNPAAQVGQSVGLGYSFNPVNLSPPPNQPYDDLIQGVAALTTGAPAGQAGVINTFPNNANVRHEVIYPVSDVSSSTFVTVARNTINLTNPTPQTLSGPTTNTNYLFDSAGNLVRIFDTPYVVFDHGVNVTPTTTQFPVATPLADAQVSFGGGNATPAENFYDPNTQIRLGRWQGGFNSVLDLASGQSYLDPLDNRSVQWLVAPGVTSLPISGQFHYTRILDGSGNFSFATAPTDSYGNVGVLEAARLSVDFTNLKASAGVRASIASGPGGSLGMQTLSSYFADAPISSGGGFNVSSNPAQNPPNTDNLHVGCIGPGCAPNQNYGGRIRGGFSSSTAAPNTADGAFFRYTFNTNYPDAATAAANDGRAFNDYINGLVAFKQGPAIVAPSTSPAAGPSNVLATYTSQFIGECFGPCIQTQTQSFEVRNPANLTLDGSGNLVSVTEDIDSTREEQNSLTISGGTPTPAAATQSSSFANNGITFGWRSNSPTLTVSGSDFQGPFSNRQVLPDGLSWVRGPGIYPFYLPGPIATIQNSGGTVVSGSRTFTLDGATAPRDQFGMAGTLNSASLSVNFNQQAVNFAMQATAPNLFVWNASANNIRLGSGEFSASTGGETTNPPGVDTHQLLTLSYTAPGVTQTFGNIQGQLMGPGITGAGVVYNFNADNGDRLNGALAFNNSAPYSVFTPYRIFGSVSGMTPLAATFPEEATSIDVQAVAPSRVQIDPSTGVPVKFDGRLRFVSTPTGCTFCSPNLKENSAIFAVAGATGLPAGGVGTATALESGTNGATGIVWARYGGGTIGVTDRITNTAITQNNDGVTPLIDVTTNNVHAIGTRTQSGPTVLPVSGAFVYNKVGNTSPTDNLGNLGTLNSATIAANFSSMTVNSAVDLTVAGNHWAASTLNRPIQQGTYFFADKGLDSAGSLNISTDRAGSDPRVQGELAGIFTGQTGNGAMLLYSLNQGGDSSVGGTTVSGVAAFQRNNTPITAPTVTGVSGFPTSTTIHHEARYSISEVASTDTFATLIRNSINLNNPVPQTLSGPTTDTNYVFDPSGNLLAIQNTPYVIFDHATNVAPTTTQFPTPTPLTSAQVTFGSGGSVAAEEYFDPNTQIRLGRWQGGNVSIFDLSSGQTYTDPLGVRSAQWLVAQQPLSLPVTGSYHYVRINDGAGNPSFATAPTDSYGNVGTLDRARLTANFTAQRVSAGLQITMPSGPGGSLGTQTLSGFFDRAPIQSDSGFNVSSNPLQNPPNTDFFHISCVGGGCAPSQTYGGRVRGGFSSATGGSGTADGAFYRYTFNTNYADAATAASFGRVFDDYIDGMVAFQQGPQIVTPPQGLTNPSNGTSPSSPSSVLTTYRFFDTTSGFTQSRTDRFLVLNSSNQSTVFSNVSNVATDSAGNLLSVTRDDISFFEEDRALSIISSSGSIGGSPNPATPISALNNVTLGWRDPSSGPPLTVSGIDSNFGAENCFGTTGCPNPARTVLNDGLAWVRGPAPFPSYLPDVIAANSNAGGTVTTGTASYTLSASLLPRDQNGAAGTLNSASLFVDFSRQAVNFAMQATTPATANGPNVWNASANNIKLESGEFSAFSGGPATTTPPGIDTHQQLNVSLTNGNGTFSGFGDIQGALMGANINAAGVTYALAGFDGATNVSASGAMAFSGPNQPIIASYRLIGLVTGMNPAGQIESERNTSITGGFVSPFRTQNVNGFPVRVDGDFPVVVSPTCSPTPCPPSTTNIGVVYAAAGATGVPSIGTATLLESGTDLSTGISWGRYGNGTIGVTDRISGASLGTIDVTSQNVHFIATGTQAGPTVLPVSGTFNYTLVGATSPTDNLGNVGTLGSATLSANFSAQTASAAVNLSVGGNSWSASAANMPIRNAIFGATKPLGGTGSLTVTSSLGANTAGVMIGGFTGQTGNGAALLYSLNHGGNIATNPSAVTVSGVAAFKR